MIAPEQDAVRLRALDLCKVLDTPPERAFDRLVFTASQALRTPIAAVVFVDAVRAWFKARVGVNMTEIPRRDAFAAEVVESGALTIVEDVANALRHWRHPLVRREPRVRFFAGAPVFGPFGQAVGALSVLDRRARSLSPEQERLLIMLGQEATGLVMSRIDQAALGTDRPG